jgi:hypothetical protein
MSTLIRPSFSSWQLKHDRYKHGCDDPHACGERRKSFLEGETKNIKTLDQAEATARQGTDRHAISADLARISARGGDGSRRTDPANLGSHLRRQDKVLI